MGGFKKYETMTREELIRSLRSIELLRDWNSNERTLAEELAVFHEEIEAQNAALRDAQTSLEESRSRLNLLFEHAPIPYLTLSRQGAVRSLNLAASDLFGRERALLSDTPFFLLVPPGDRQRFWDHITSVRRALPRETVSTDLSLTRHDGRVVQVRLQSVPPDPYGDIFLTIFDLTQIREIERERERVLAERIRREEAERANRSKDDFLATVSHELRTPLNTISGWTHILLANNPSEYQLRGLEVIKRSVASQAKVLDDLMDVSRIVRGLLQLERRETDFAGVVEKAVEANRPAADARDIQVALVVDGDAGFVVLGDPARLEQVVSNLLVNALKYTAPHGQVEIRVERTDVDGLERVRMAVRDTGIGIAATELHRIFDRFEQLASPSTRVRSGMGVGLAIVRHIVEAHAGRVWAESKGPGQGTTLFVELPLRPGVQIIEPMPETASVVVSASLHGVTVLVADDDPDARELTVQLLEPAGAEVWTANNVPDALQTLVRQRPAILVSDIAMPVEDGYSLIERVRQLRTEEGGDTPAIAMTAFGGVADRERALAAGFNRWLAKPCSPTVLINTIADLTLQNLQN